MNIQFNKLGKRLSAISLVAILSVTSALTTSALKFGQIYVEIDPKVSSVQIQNGELIISKLRETLPYGQGPLENYKPHDISSDKLMESTDIITFDELRRNAMPFIYIEICGDSRVITGYVKFSKTGEAMFYLKKIYSDRMERAQLLLKMFRKNVDLTAALKGKKFFTAYDKEEYNKILHPFIDENEEERRKEEKIRELEEGLRKTDETIRKIKEEERKEEERRRKKKS